MKNSIFLFLLSLSACTAQTQASDETAIQSVIEADTRAWLAADMEAWLACWQIQPYTKQIVSLPDGTLLFVTSEQLKTENAKVMGSGGAAVNTNYSIHVNGATAWSDHDQVTTNAKGEKTYSKEMKMLEKINGAWKIVAQSTHVYIPK